jgi:hypothetical protein
LPPGFIACSASASSAIAITCAHLLDQASPSDGRRGRVCRQDLDIRELEAEVGDRPITGTLRS